MPLFATYIGPRVLLNDEHVAMLHMEFQGPWDEAWELTRLWREAARVGAIELPPDVRLTIWCTDGECWFTLQNEDAPQKFSMRGTDKNQPECKSAFWSSNHTIYRDGLQPQDRRRLTLEFLVARANEFLFSLSPLPDPPTDDQASSASS